MKFKKLVILALGAIGIAMFSTLASAQQMYRCGNNYQDTPCEPGRETKRLGNTNATRAAAGDGAPPAAAADTQCAPWGDASMKIVWAREAGMTMERQLSDAKSDLQRRLISSVYQKRGSAPAIRSQIEAECKDEQDKKKQVQALAAAAAQIRSSLPPDSVTTDAPVAKSESSGTNGNSIAAAAEARNHKATCDRLNESMQATREEQRAGGGTVTMDRLNQKKRNLETVLRTNGC
jgi:hypothetical protein